MTEFNEREKAFEAKFKLDEELRFKANARRNRLLGVWAAEQMGLGESDADAYAKEVVKADFEKPGDDEPDKIQGMQALENFRRFCAVYLTRIKGFKMSWPRIWRYLKRLASRQLF